MQPLQQQIETAFDRRDEFNASSVDTETKKAINDTIELLDKGELRIAEKRNGDWHTNEWAKKAVLLLFKIQNNTLMSGGFTKFFDKVPLKFANYDHESLAQTGVRIVPPANIRKGAFVAPNTVVMPSFVNIGAYVDTGTMVDTWASVGCCAQIGKNVHISGGAGIGGILEPLQANPTIIEDNCFIGARSEIVEGVIVETGAVISMGVFIGQSTPIYNRHTKEITFGRVPAGAVVIPGALPSKDGSYSRYCALIMKQVDEKTRSKVSINELLRGDE